LIQFGLDGCNLDMVFAPKPHNHSGMQLADMVARPIGRHVLDPTQPNRAYEILVRKFWGAPAALGVGLHVLPRRGEAAAIQESDAG
jgi:hypothetical protein